MDTQSGRKINQGVTDIITIAHVGQRETAKFAEFFFEREEVGECLAGMKTIRKSVNDGNSDGIGHLIKNSLLVDTRDNPLDPAFEIASHVRNGLALPEARLGVVEKHNVAPHALDADLKGDPGTERGLLEYQGDVLSTQRGGIFRGACLDIGGAVE